MNIQKAFRACITVLKRLPADKPIKTPYGEFKAEEVLDTIKKLNGWCFPGIDGCQFERVIHCRECEFYRKFRKKNSPARTVKWLCARDKSEKPAHFYCGYAKERAPDDE